jgi:hypothetical protein
MDPSVDGDGDGPLSCTSEGVSDSCLVKLFWRLNEWPVLARRFSDFECPKGRWESVRLSSSSGIDFSRSISSSSSYSSSDESGLSWAAGWVVLFPLGFVEVVFSRYTHSLPPFLHPVEDRN